MTLTDDNAMLRRVSLDRLLAELKRRQLNRPFTGVPRLTAQALVDMFVEEDRANAVLLVARLAEVAVAYLDREVIEARLRVRFTDAQWARVAEHLDEYDEFLDNSGADESISAFVDHAVKQAGLALDFVGPHNVVVDTTQVTA